jgi:putative ABC transport system permease protein
VTSGTVIWRNLWRNKVRTGLTVGSVAVSLFLCTALQAVIGSMHELAADSARQLRLVVRQKTTMIKLLPAGYGPKIAALPGVEAVCAMRWFGGRLEDSAEQFPSVAAERATFLPVYADMALSPAEAEAWRTERTAAVVGSGLARRMGWRPGQRVVLRATIPPYPSLEFRIVAITPARAYPNFFIFALDYLTDTLVTAATMPPYYKDGVNFYWVKATSAAALGPVRSAIDARFAQSPDPTRTEPEQSFAEQFTKMFGDIPRIVGGVGIIVVVSIILVVGNTMSMTIRERTRELAVLKAMGFSRARILALVVGEAAGLGLLGGVVGCAAALLVFRRSTEAGLSIPFFPVVTVSPALVGLGIAAGAVVGLLAGLLPTRQLARLSVTTMLRDEG